MGPRLFRRGNLPAASKQWSLFGELQWGHVFSDVEIGVGEREPGSRPGFNGATSFQTWK